MPLVFGVSLSTNTCWLYYISTLYNADKLARKAANNAESSLSKHIVIYNKAKRIKDNTHKKPKKGGIRQEKAVMVRKSWSKQRNISNVTLRLFKNVQRLVAGILTGHC